MNRRALSLYVHIPFCTSLCHYCSFPRVLTPSADIYGPYLESLFRELDATPRALRERALHTVYIGGGTPSAAGVAFIVKLAHYITALWNHPPMEFTVECNPDDLDATWQPLVDSPVNRVSLGVQTFRNPQSLGRRHSAQQARAAIKTLRAFGFGNLSIDLIFGLPLSTGASLQDDLLDAIGLAPEHISLYGLSVDEGTRLHEQVTSGAVVVPGDDEWAAQWALGRDVLEARGYRQYEISNFARPGYESMHNLAYWEGGEYLGVGSGAASRLGNLRWYNPFGPDRYMATEFRPWTLNPPWAEDLESLDPAAVLKEKMMTGLRLTRGIRRDLFPAGGPLGQCVDDFLGRGLMTTEGGRIRFTDSGRLISDGILATLFNAIDAQVLSSA